MKAVPPTTGPCCSNALRGRSGRRWLATGGCSASGCSLCCRREQLALAYVLGTSVAAIQRVEVVNRSGRPLEQVSLSACRSAKCDVGALAPGERCVWRFSPSSEGTLSVTGELDGETVALEDAYMFFVFDRIDVTLELQPNGAWTVREAPGAPWSWLPWR